MKRISREFGFAIGLVLLSAFVYYLHFLIFRDPHHIFIYLVGDIAFVFIEVLLVSLILHRVLEHREKKKRMEKLNMVIGGFFSETGSRLLQIFADLDPDSEKLQQKLKECQGSAEQELESVSQWMESHDFSIQKENVDWESIRKFLSGKREFLLGLMQNPNLLEHESFTDVLWAVFHFLEELEEREDLQNLPEEDYEHLQGDLVRVYERLAWQWLQYMGHLRESYPYLFSLALRTNPFKAKASAVIRES